ncbi:hypothetical protein [Longimicrobium sp.]|uniref:hypothetical protein n=1 Tax=Longimicrobium sp. TaxID=2029185 RepID=UPI002D15C799|nr:hypothetical protein [Longimicrobium sp.]HSU13551.1 hypothetical protein [Longimicrobium sp.]
MKKLKLSLDALHVESYEPSRAPQAAEGTVHGHESFSRLGQQTCGGMSCDYACVTLYDNTCRNVCAV